MSKELQFLIYNTPEENVSVNAVIKDETIWLTQKAMAELFDCTADNISLHLKNIYADGELNESSTTEEFSVVQQEGSREVKRKIKFYNLDAIISVGYRVNSRKATHFRIWATGVLKEYMIKGFAMDDERLKQGKTAFGKDYFRELLERVRSIRASERRIWQQITDIFAECSIDYGMHRLHVIFMLWCKINFIMLSLGKQRQKLFIRNPIAIKKIWVLQRGKTHQTGEY